MFFELALRKSRLSPEEVWYCGDRVDNDVEGSSRAGLFPVWYTGICGKGQEEPDCVHWKVGDWEEVIHFLQ